MTVSTSEDIDHEPVVVKLCGDLSLLTRYMDRELANLRGLAGQRPCGKPVLMSIDRLELLASRIKLFSNAIAINATSQEADGAI